MVSGNEFDLEAKSSTQSVLPFAVEKPNGKCVIGFVTHVGTTVTVRQTRYDDDGNPVRSYVTVNSTTISTGGHDYFLYYTTELPNSTYCYYDWPDTTSVSGRCEAGSTMVLRQLRVYLCNQR